METGKDRTKHASLVDLEIVSLYFSLLWVDLKNLANWQLYFKNLMQHAEIYGDIFLCQLEMPRKVVIQVFPGSHEPKLGHKRMLVKILTYDLIH